MKVVLTLLLLRKRNRYFKYLPLDIFKVIFDIVKKDYYLENIKDLLFYIGTNYDIEQQYESKAKNFEFTDLQSNPSQLDRIENNIKLLSIQVLDKTKLITFRISKSPEHIRISSSNYSFTYEQICLFDKDLTASFKTYKIINSFKLIDYDEFDFINNVLKEINGRILKISIYNLDRDLIKTICFIGKQKFEIIE